MSGDNRADKRFASEARQAQGTRRVIWGALLSFSPSKPPLQLCRIEATAGRARDHSGRTQLACVAKQRPTGLISPDKMARRPGSACALGSLDWAARSGACVEVSGAPEQKGVETSVVKRRRGMQRRRHRESLFKTTSATITRMFGVRGAQAELLRENPASSVFSY